MTISQAQKHADQLVSNLVDWGLLIKVSAGKFRPATSKLCGTCKAFHLIAGENGYGACEKQGNKRHMSETCGNHQLNKLIIDLIDAGLPS